jgi:hypothetical protein
MLIDRILFPSGALYSWKMVSAGNSLTSFLDLIDPADLRPEF